MHNWTCPINKEKYCDKNGFLGEMIKWGDDIEEERKKKGDMGEDERDR